MDRAALKARAKELRRQTVPHAALVTLVLMFIFYLLERLEAVGYIRAVSWGNDLGFSLTGILCGIITMFFEYSYSAHWALNAARGENAQLSDLIEGFRRFGDVFVLHLLIGLYTFLWSLLFVIPGIVKSYSYALAPYILRDNPGMRPSEAITLSRELMDGHKMELFVLQLSFIGWVILSVFTAGILLLWVIPWFEITKSLFYMEVKGERGAYPFKGLPGEDSGTYTLTSFPEEESPFADSPYYDPLYEEDDNDDRL